MSKLIETATIQQQLEGLQVLQNLRKSPRDSKLENKLLQIGDASSVFTYAFEILKSRFLKGEPIIATSPMYSTNYARHILQTRFPQGENSISLNAALSTEYAEEVIGGRFELGEPSILKSSIWEVQRYWSNCFNQKPWREGEKLIFGQPYTANQYLKSLKIDKTNPEEIKELEKSLLLYGVAESIVGYVELHKKERFIEAEPIIIACKKSHLLYVDHLKLNKDEI